MMNFKQYVKLRETKENLSISNEKAQPAQKPKTSKPNKDPDLERVIDHIDNINNNFSKNRTNRQN